MKHETINSNLPGTIAAALMLLLAGLFAIISPTDAYANFGPTIQCPSYLCEDWEQRRTFLEQQIEEACRWADVPGVSGAPGWCYASSVDFRVTSGLGGEWEDYNDEDPGEIADPGDQLTDPPDARGGGSGNTSPNQN